MKDPFKTQEGGGHYKKLAIQPMQYALKNGLDYGQANVVKYVTRFKDKAGLEDLKKAKHCIDLLIAHYYPESLVPVADFEGTKVPEDLESCKHADISKFIGGSATCQKCGHLVDTNFQILKPLDPFQQFNGMFNEPK